MRGSGTTADNGISRSGTTYRSAVRVVEVEVPLRDEHHENVDGGFESDRRRGVIHLEALKRRVELVGVH